MSATASARRATVTAPPRTLELSARETGYGRWKLLLESRSAPGTAYELNVTDQQAGPCTCDGARFGHICRHRQHAARIAAALDAREAARACIAAEYATYDRESGVRIARWQAEMLMAEMDIAALGYRLVRIETVRP